MTESGRPTGAGLHAERTALAWRRTCLSLALGWLAALRFLPEVWGWWGVGIAGIGLLAAVSTITISHRRYEAARSDLGARAQPALPDGRLPALLAATGLAAGVVAALLIFCLPAR